MPIVDTLLRQDVLLGLSKLCGRSYGIMVNHKARTSALSVIHTINRSLLVAEYCVERLRFIRSKVLY